MDRAALKALLQELESGAVTTEEVMTALQDFPSGRLGMRMSTIIDTFDAGFRRSSSPRGIPPGMARPRHTSS